MSSGTKTIVQLSLSPADLNLVLVALGQLPYVEVHQLIGHIQTEAGPQLLAAVQPEGGTAEAARRR